MSETEHIPCHYCGEITEARRVDIGITLRLPGMHVRLGPHHDRNCCYWRKEKIEDT